MGEWYVPSETFALATLQNKGLILITCKCWHNIEICHMLLTYNRGFVAVYYIHVQCIEKSICSTKCWLANKSRNTLTQASKTAAYNKIFPLKFTSFFITVPHLCKDPFKCENYMKKWYKLLIYSKHIFYIKPRDLDFRVA